MKIELQDLEHRLKGLNNKKRELEETEVAVKEYLKIIENSKKVEKDIEKKIKENKIEL